MNRMFPFVTKTVNLAVGCQHACLYCWARQQAKRQKHRCPQCYEFKPHLHLNRPVPKLHAGSWIFLCSMGDLLCTGFSDDDINEVLRIIKCYPQLRFLICSKNPKRFHNFINTMPTNCILGTTIETNNDRTVSDWSKAPPPSERYTAMATLNYPHKMVSIEPIMDFDKDILMQWVKEIKPELIAIGYNNYPRFKLPEPPLDKTIEFISSLRTVGYKVVEKTIRKAWYEK